MKPKDKIETILKLYNNNISMVEIAKQIGCSYTTVNRYINKYISKNNRRIYITRKFSESQINEMKKLYSENCPITTIAKKFNVNPYTIRYHLKEEIENNPRRPRKRKFTTTEKILIKELSKFETVEHIARILNISEENLKDYVVQYYTI